MQHHVSPETMTRLLRRAQEAGADFTPPVWRWRLTDCESPREVSYTSYAKLGEKSRANGTGQGGMLYLLAACRRCARCLRRRARLWASRAIAEAVQSKRTWLCTFTLRADALAKLRYHCELARTKKGLPKLGTCTKEAEWAALAAAGGPELTRAIKRVRANTGERFRYLLVCEPHKSGNPHWHALIHEHAAPILKRQIQAEWREGFSNAKLIAPERAGYVAKYLSKHYGARVRASKMYGRMITA